MCSRLIWNYVVYSKLYLISFGFFGSIDALNVSNAYCIRWRKENRRVRLQVYSCLELTTFDICIHVNVSVFHILFSTRIYFSIWIITKCQLIFYSFHEMISHSHWTNMKKDKSNEANKNKTKKKISQKQHDEYIERIQFPKKM